MPEICRFLGIVIAMYYRDHAPPHFHAVYGAYEIIVDIGSGTFEGRFPTLAKLLVLEWRGLHREELMEDWDLARSGLPLEQIPPLE